METGIRIRTLIGACLAAALPCLALAGPPANSDMARGEIEGIIQFCIKSNPGHAQDLEKEMTLLTSTLSPAGARGTAAYKQGYDLVTDALGKAAKQQIVASCASIAAAGVAPPRRPDAHGRR
jgi:hypothetical protein